LRKFALAELKAREQIARQRVAGATITLLTSTRGS
jgi:hypothetical protein